ncbi:right-handed parallel beta-helix repeat-containing protein [Pedobacter agri]|uniref:right-handed parallel beta-helix repeat-containing protein n=1 Tax=Pedobacter agri TaxID=454586 RepID=UPI002781033E|nr:right-handed parallel beta-helix repeat-containing protein [Pedobacter agri]MDQ1141202.1 hypothetical protein [Pedobacter agri]
MNKLSFIVGTVLSLLSCTKSSSLLDAENNKVLDITSSQTFFSYNLKGDGLTDETKELQKLLDSSSEIYLKAGTYIINNTLKIKAKTKFVGENGTILKAGNNMDGDLLQHGRYILAERSHQALIKNIKFSQSENPYSFKEWANSCIFILNSKNVNVESCNFDFHFKYQRTGMEAVWVSGTESTKATLKKNIINSLGIRYAENGSDSTLVELNILNNAYSNALSATGSHPNDMIKGCKILQNKIFNAGRMGIEDWGNTTGTIIQGNIINGTGKDPVQAFEGIALSAVGRRTTVMNNVIQNGKLYGIEVRGNYGVQVIGNRIEFAPSETGIILNYTFTPPEADLPVANVSNNSISGTSIGMHIFGDNESNANIWNNTFINTKSKSISIESGASKYLINLSNNKISFSEPNDGDRFAVFSYTKFESGKVNQILKMSADTIIFSTTAARGKGVDFGLVIRTDDAIIDNLRVFANDNKNANGVQVNAITALGATPKNITFNHNLVQGGLVDLKGFINFKLNENNFVR